jgi:hypothetical protein
MTPIDSWSWPWLLTSLGVLAVLFLIDWWWLRRKP